MSDEASFRERIVTDGRRIAQIAASARRVAVLGIKTEAQAGQPAYYVPAYLASAGVEVVPVPVYYPDVTEILGRPVFRRVADVPGPIDIVNVFRRSQDVPAHVDDILAKRPACVWMQSGIRHAEVAERLAREGIVVVQDECLMVEHRHGVSMGLGR
ncbi:CoA-binding protein [Polyangium aurulentum]|uniref:CoA-binding protein n=1 Tax=Polyangium aurulentum TaxID=2567896 RepID=UPI0010AE4EBA|nr:CoA-binding protein [Polyangium aurulentum]UQA60721.1 CoA-binding protein [Polyangium aurulentum]